MIGPGFPGAFSLVLLTCCGRVKVCAGPAPLRPASSHGPPVCLCPGLRVRTRVTRDQDLLVTGLKLDHVFTAPRLQMQPYPKVLGQDFRMNLG